MDVGSVPACTGMTASASDLEGSSREIWSGYRRCGAGFCDIVTFIRVVGPQTFVKGNGLPFHCILDIAVDPFVL